MPAQKSDKEEPPTIVFRSKLAKNLWKDIPAGDNPPELLNMIIEVTSDSRDKYEYSPEWDAFVLDMIIPSSVISS
jgi:hypothetical protein